MKTQSVRKVSSYTRDLEEGKIKFTVKKFRNYFEKILREEQAKNGGKIQIQSQAIPPLTVGPGYQGTSCDTLLIQDWIDQWIETWWAMWYTMCSDLVKNSVWNEKAIEDQAIYTISHFASETATRWQWRELTGELGNEMKYLR